MIENIALMVEGAFKLAQDTLVYGASTAGGLGGVYLLYKAGKFIQKI